MKYLLDTHILLWSQSAPENLTDAQREILTSVTYEKYLSTISAWEISLKFALDKLDLSGHTPEEFLIAMKAQGIKIITPTPEQYVTFHRLPSVMQHRDPFDRMIIWHAMQSGLTLVSSDQKLKDYTPHGLAVV